MNLNPKKKEEAPLKKKLFRCVKCDQVKKRKFIMRTPGNVPMRVSIDGKVGFVCKVCCKPSQAMVTS